MARLCDLLGVKNKSVKLFFASLHPHSQ